MKFSTIAGVLAVAASAIPSAVAFPSYLKELGPEQIAALKRAEPSMATLKKRLQVFPVVVPGRKQIPDADHPFIAPGPTDVRGPCPGLNTMANHGYISRTGVTSSGELAWAMQEAFGLGLDLAEFLGLLSIAVDGNPVADKVSIGGADSRVPPLLLDGLLGGQAAAGGIGRHNAYEIDSSLTRQDKYFGNNFVMQGDLYELMFKTADKVSGGRLTVESQAVYRSVRYNDSAARNPEFKFVPIGVLFFGADHFPWRTLVSTGPDGKNVPATREALASTYGAKSLGNGKWEYIPERFPDEWYRSAVPFTIPEIVSYAVASLVYAAANGGGLPLGFNPAKVNDPAYVTCQILSTGVEQIPSALQGLPILGDIVNQMSKGFPGC